MVNSNLVCEACAASNNAVLTKPSYYDEMGICNGCQEIKNVKNKNKYIWTKPVLKKCKKQQH